MRLDVGTSLGPYEIVEPLGAGGMGEVYRARDTRLDRTVAIKVLPRHLSDDPQLAQRFEREAKSLSSLSHPHICTLHDVGESDGVHFLVMEHLQGDTLAERLKKGPLPPEQLLRYAGEIADALDAAHRHGVTHRDLKPGNIMLTRSGAKLVDFGLARSDGVLISPTRPGATQAPTHTFDPLTAEGTIMGTLHYMAPEQTEGKEADARSDLFAFGAVLYEMGTGRKAFPGESQASIIAAILSSEPAPMSTLRPMTPPALDRLVRRCLAKDPEHRWQSARDLMLELKWIAGAGAGADAPAAGIDRRRRRERWAWAAAVLGLIGALGLALVFTDEAVDEAQSLRLSLSLPKDAAGTFARISPDGRHVVFGMTTGGERQLWLRPLDGTTAEPLPHTLDAYFPFWSPDSGFVGFFAEGKLKKIDVSGGPPQTLCDAPGTFQMGTWAADGTILFNVMEAPGEEGIYRVSASGGPAAPLTVLDDSGGELWGAYPWFLPDGRHFLFRCWQESPTPEDLGLCIASLDSGRGRQLLDALSPVSRAEYASPGYLLYVRGQTLLAQSFDVDELRLQGDPVAVAERVEEYGPGLYNFSVSQSGVLTYQISDAQSRLLWKDRSGRIIEEVGAPADYFDLRLSPDGRKLAVARRDDRTGLGDVWIVELGRNMEMRFTTEKTDDDAFFPVWSPEGSRIVFCDADEAPPFLHHKPVTGGEAEILVPTTGTLRCPADWSPDGRFILYVDRHPTNSYDLWLLPMTGKDREPTPYLVTRFREMSAAFSPEGDWLAFVSDESGRREVYVQPFQRPGERLRVSTAGGLSPRWRRDGRELFYVSEDGQLMAVPTQLGESFVPGAPQALFPLPSNTSWIRTYDVSADGQRFIVISPMQESSPQPTVVVNWAADLKTGSL